MNADCHITLHMTSKYFFSDHIGVIAEQLNSIKVTNLHKQVSLLVETNFHQELTCLKQCIHLEFIAISQRRDYVTDLTVPLYCYINIPETG